MEYTLAERRHNMLNQIKMAMIDNGFMPDQVANNVHDFETIKPYDKATKQFTGDMLVIKNRHGLLDVLIKNYQENT